jgi:hypothetical protein
MEAGNARGGMRRIRKFAGVSLQFNWDGERRATVPKASARWIGQGVEGYRATRPACNTRTLPSPARGSDVASRNRGWAKTSFARRPPRLLSSPTDSALWRMARSAQRTSTPNYYALGENCLPERAPSACGLLCIIIRKIVPGSWRLKTQRQSRRN